jgi:hypothetical protein
MFTRIIVEIEPNGAGALPARLISAAYQASCTAPVTLVLRGTSPSAVDRVLDPIVVSGRRDVCGVRYVSASDTAAVRVACETAHLGIARTPELRTLLAEAGVPCSWPEEADGVLGDRRASIASVRGGSLPSSQISELAGRR